jgi:DNA-binding response OmpR family regulator
MGLNALLLCSDERMVRVLRRVLSELEIEVHHCSDAQSAIRKLTRQRFEAVIVDYDDGEVAGQVLRSARSAPSNKSAIAVAILDERQVLRSAFDQGAHFVLYKPISMERAKSSFRAARALMKRERRRNMRVPVEIPVTLTTGKDLGPVHTSTIDLAEGGMAVQLKHRLGNIRQVRASFMLPGNSMLIECGAEIAWESAQKQTGIRFKDLSVEAAGQIKTWLMRNTPGIDADDPPVKCRLTDLSVGACYLKMSAPFPVRTMVTLSMQTGISELRAEGVVRVMHPEFGMGVEFTRNTAQQRERVEAFIHQLAGSGALPDLRVEPDGLLREEEQAADATSSNDDPLLNLFQRTELSAQAFDDELARQRAVHDDSAMSV